MQWLELFLVGLVILVIGAALALSAAGLITIPDALYQALSTIALGLFGSRGRRIAQRRALRKKFDEAPATEPGYTDDDRPPEEADPWP